MKGKKKFHFSMQQSFLAIPALSLFSSLAIQKSISWIGFWLSLIVWTDGLKFVLKIFWYKVEVYCCLKMAASFSGSLAAKQALFITPSPLCLKLV